MPTKRKTAKKLPIAYIAAPSNGLNRPPKPEPALNIPRFFSRSFFSLYRRSSAYSPTMLAAIEIPTNAALVNAIARKEELVVVHDANAIRQKAALKINPEVKIVASTPTVSMYLCMKGTDTMVIRGLIARIRPVTIPVTSYSLARRGKNTGMVMLPRACQPTPMQNILRIPVAIDFWFSFIIISSHLWDSQ